MWASVWSGRRSVAAAVGVVMGATVGAAPAAAGPARVSPAAYRPLWATPTAAGGTAAADLGAAGAGAPVAARIYLTGRDPHGLAATATAVSDPKGSRYRHFLGSGEVRARFGPAAARRAAVVSWLAGTGLRVTGGNDHYVAVSGTAAGAARAFGTTWHSFRVTAGIPQLGTTVATTPQQAPPPGAAVSVPAALGADVLTVVPMETGIPGYLDPGTTTTTPDAAPVTTPAPAANPPCSRYFGERVADDRPAAYGARPAYAVCGYTPQQLRGAYGVPASLTGAGQSIAVVAGGRNPTTPTDLATFAERHGQPLHAGQFTQVLPTGLDSSCRAEGPQFSEDFGDLELTHAMAPGAHLTYLGAKCDDDGEAVPILDAYGTIADHHLASVVPSAYNARYNEATLSPGLIAIYEQVFQQGAVEGIGYYVDSDDEGDDSSVSPDHRPTVSFPDNDPWVTAVGGTSLAIGPDGRYDGESSWGDHNAALTRDGTAWADLPGAFLAGGGGGASRVFHQPRYQHGVVPAALGRTMRVLPDIAADAGSGTGMLVGVTAGPGGRPGGPLAYQEFSFAGTSSSVQLIAGIQADTQQAGHGTAIGFANPAIYARYGTSAYHDVTAHSFRHGLPADSTGPSGALRAGGDTAPFLTTFGQDQTLTAGTGFDDTTGVGTPTADYLRSYR